MKLAIFAMILAGILLLGCAQAPPNNGQNSNAAPQNTQGGQPSPAGGQAQTGGNADVAIPPDITADAGLDDSIKEIGAVGSPDVKLWNSIVLGMILTDANGMTLYTFSKDVNGASSCYDACEAKWPPLIVSTKPLASADATGRLGTTERKGGKLQATYNGQPLYYYSGDSKPGGTDGQGFNNAWYVVPG